jgi:hypothetical protein
MNLNTQLDLRNWPHRLSAHTFGARVQKSSSQNRETPRFLEKTQLPPAGWATFALLEQLCNKKSARASHFLFALCVNVFKNASVQKSPRVHLSQNSRTSKMFLSEF